MSGNPSPFDFEGARSMLRKASEAQAKTEEALAKAHEERSQAEHDYRVALSARIIKANAVEGIAWTTCQDVAKGAEEVARLRKIRDDLDGQVEVLQQSGWRHAADRRGLEKLIDWSMRVAPDGQHEPLRSAA